MERIRPRRDQDERATTIEMLDFYRATLRTKCNGLDALGAVID